MLTACNTQKVKAAILTTASLNDDLRMGSSKMLLLLRCCYLDL
jgi:hypothetical protein